MTAVLMYCRTAVVLPDSPAMWPGQWKCNDSRTNVLQNSGGTAGQSCHVAGIAQSVQRLATGWTVWGSNSGEGEIFRTRPDRPWGPPNLLYSGYRVFSGGKAAGAWR